MFVSATLIVFLVVKHDSTKNCETGEAEKTSIRSGLKFALSSGLVFLTMLPYQNIENKDFMAPFVMHYKVSLFLIILNAILFLSGALISYLMYAN